MRGGVYGMERSRVCFLRKFCSSSCTQTCINFQKLLNYLYGNCDILNLLNSTTLVVFVLFYVLFVCKCVLPPGDNPIAVNKYIIYNSVASSVVSTEIIVDLQPVKSLHFLQKKGNYQSYT